MYYFSLVIKEIENANIFSHIRFTKMKTVENVSCLLSHEKMDMLIGRNTLTQLFFQSSDNRFQILGVFPLSTPLLGILFKNKEMH